MEASAHGNRYAKQSQTGRILQMGLREDAVEIATIEDVPDAVRKEIAGLSLRIADGDLAILTVYFGPEVEAAA